MIAKTFLTAKGFGETSAYLCRDLSRSQVLAAEGVRAHDWKLMAADFEWQHGLMPEKEKPVYHCVLSFSPGEVVSDERLVELGRRYLEKIGMVNTQYAFVKHSDTEHLHVHILANRVNNDGEPIGKGLIIERGIKAAAELTSGYGLRPEKGKRLDQTNMEALHEPDAKRYRIYRAIQEQLPECRGLDELEKKLLQRGITMRYRYDVSTGERQGISFRLENMSFKGSRVDRMYSLKALERTLALQEELRQKPGLFEGKEFGERMRLMRDDGLRKAEERRLKELELQRGQRLGRGLRQ
ncbi:MAG: relaxase/mobilization nuclease domain-containing protein [Bacteroidetes bacterium]|nr:relaxase/mobilization nuclease domain-containing protein [Bacteroidota bacterium]